MPPGATALRMGRRMVAFAAAIVAMPACGGVAAVVSSDAAAGRDGTASAATASGVARPDAGEPPLADAPQGDADAATDAAQEGDDSADGSDTSQVGDDSAASGAGETNEASPREDGSASASGTTSTGDKCGPIPTIFVTPSGLFLPCSLGLSAALDLAVNETDLYVAVNGNLNGAILRVPLSGALPSTVATVEGSEQSLVLTNDFVVFAESHDDGAGGWSGEIVRVNLDGADPTVLFAGDISSTNIFGPSGTLATDGANAYFAAQDGVRSVPLSGGAATTLTAHTGAMALVGSSVVIADTSAEGIFSVPTGGGPVTALATGLSGNLGPIAPCGDSVCFASELEVGAAMKGTEQLQRLDPSGQVTSLSQGSALYVVYRLAFDGTDFFATMLADVSAGTLARIPAMGGTPVIGGVGAGLAVDDTCLYVADIADGVYSIAKTAWNVAPMP